MRPWLIQSWMRSRFMGAISTAKLLWLLKTCRDGLCGPDIHVVESTLTVDDDIRRLTTIEMRRNLPMLLLTLMTTSRGLTLARSRTTTTADALVVRGGIVGERGEDRGCAGGLELRGEEGQRGWLGQGPCDELLELRWQPH